MGGERENLIGFGRTINLILLFNVIVVHQLSVFDSQ